jgi:Fe-S cluster biogenesis protein NfuA
VTAVSSPVPVVDQDSIEARIHAVSHLMSAHGGRIELLSVSDAGKVRVRFRGLCTACALKPITLTAIVRPALMSIPGVEEVEAVGVHLSEEARERLESVR